MIDSPEIPLSQSPKIDMSDVPHGAQIGMEPTMPGGPLNSTEQAGAQQQAMIEQQQQQEFMKLLEAAAVENAKAKKPDGKKVKVVPVQKIRVPLTERLKKTGENMKKGFQNILAIPGRVMTKISESVGGLRKKILPKKESKAPLPPQHGQATPTPA